jgi:DDE_Tnp_1-associated
MSLINYLQQIPDFRTQPRYPLWVVLVLVIMGVMSGCQGYRALEDFVVRHQAVLLELLELPHRRLPSYSTIRRVMVRLNFRAVAHMFNAWAGDRFAPQAQEQIASDGKSIKASVIDYDQSYQEFVSLVSAFSVEQGVVVGLEVMHNGQQSEIVTVQSLLKVLGLENVCVTLDALHAQKKPLSRSSTVAMTI